MSATPPPAVPIPKVDTANGTSADSPNRLRDACSLFLISFLLLFFELAVIRWIPANIRVISYFSNLVLVSCFFGFGIGCCLRRWRDLFWFFPPLVLGLLLLCHHLSRAGVANPDADSYFFAGWGLYSWLTAVPLVFVANSLPFICIGQKMAVFLDRFRPLPGYSINVAGSLAGTVVFALFSFLGLTPLWWFVVAAVLALLFLPVRPIPLTVSAALLAAAVCLVAVETGSSHWSPYYKIDVEPLPPVAANGQRIVVNHDYHQLVQDLSGRWNGVIPGYREWQLTYELPYLVHDRQPHRVLVLGAGAGNDVAAALRNGAGRVDAVELDPEIFRLGTELHPEQPYASSRVRVVLNDARYFLRRGGHRYDLIVVGWLDSHRLFSSLSNVRQDNFVYTLESVAQMRRLLEPDGLLCLSFYAGKPWIGEKIFGMLRTVFGRDPLVCAVTEGAFGEDGLIFLMPAAPQKPPVVSAVEGVADLSDRYRTLERLPTLPTDSWPYLYYRDRVISREYLLVMIVVTALAVLMVGPAVLAKRLQAAEGMHFLLLGAGFLLLEVRNITRLALVFGSTWLTTSIVISAVLIMILMANLIVEKGLVPRHEGWIWSLLLLSIALSAVWQEEWVPCDSPLLLGVVTAVVISTTFAFAGVVFAQSFARVSIPSVALGSNVLGSVAGGMAEYFSILVGINGLAWIALVLYALALVTARVWARP